MYICYYCTYIVYIITLFVIVLPPYTLCMLVIIAVISYMLLRFWLLCLYRGYHACFLLLHLLYRIFHVYSLLLYSYRIYYRVFFYCCILTVLNYECFLLSHICHVHFLLFNKCYKGSCYKEFLLQSVFCFKDQFLENSTTILRDLFENFR